MTLEELEIKFTAQTSGLAGQLNNVKSQVMGVGGETVKTQSAFAKFAKVGAVFAGAMIGRELIQIGKEALTMANNAVESENLFEVSMGAMAGSTRAWSEDISKSLGLNAYEVRKSAGTYNVMFNSMGIGAEKAQDMSQGLTALAQDMASFYNLSPEEAFTKLSSGITGEMEPLKRLGILVDEATVSQFAYENGIADTGKALTQQQKVLARYGTIMKQTSKAQGDLARTIESPANQLRRMTAQVDQAKIALGTALQPALLAIIPVLTQMAVGAGNLFTALSGNGKNSTMFDDVAITLDEARADVAKVIENSLTDIVDNIKDLHTKTDSAMDDFATNEKRTKKLAITVNVDPPTTTGEERIGTAIDGIVAAVKGYTSETTKVITVYLDSLLSGGEITQDEYNAKIRQLNTDMNNLNLKAEKFETTTEALVNTILADGTVTEKEGNTLEDRVNKEANKLIYAINADKKKRIAFIDAQLKAKDITEETAGAMKLAVQTAAETMIGVVTANVTAIKAVAGTINWTAKTFSDDEKKALVTVLEAGVGTSTIAVEAIVGEVTATFADTGAIGAAVTLLYSGLAAQVQTQNDIIAALTSAWLGDVQPTKEQWDKAIAAVTERSRILAILGGGLTSSGMMADPFANLALDTTSIDNYFKALKEAMTSSTSSAQTLLIAQQNILKNCFGQPEWGAALAAMGLDAGTTYEEAMNILYAQMMESLNGEKNAYILDAAKKLLPSIVDAIASGDTSKITAAFDSVTKFFDNVDVSKLDAAGRAAALSIIDSFDLSALPIDAQLALAELKTAIVMGMPEVAKLLGEGGTKAMGDLLGGMYSGQITPEQYSTILSAANSKSALEKLKFEFLLAGQESAAKLVQGLLDSIVAAEAAGTAVHDAAEKGLGGGGKSYGSGVNFAQGYIDGIKGMYDAAQTAAEGLADKAWNSLKNTNEEQSPAKRPMRSGALFSKGFAIGITDSANLASRAAMGLANGAAGALSGMSLSTPSVGAGGLAGALSGASGDSNVAGAIATGIERGIQKCMSLLNINLYIDQTQLGKASFAAQNHVNAAFGFRS